MDAADIRQRMRAHLIAFGAILLLALGAAGLVLAGVSNVYMVLAIAAVQATIILTAMMHARADGPWVRGMLFFAAFFVATLLGLTALGLRSTIDGTEFTEATPAAEAAAGEAH